jgi:uncharacterized membrane protein
VILLEWYKILAILSIIFYIIGLLALYRFFKEFKKLDKNKTVEEVGLEKLLKKHSSIMIFRMILGSAFGISAILLR